MPQYHVVTLITVKDLNNDDLDGYYGSVQFGYSWSQLGAAGHTWSLSKSSTTSTLMVIALGNLVTDGHRWSHLSLGQVYLLVLVSILSTLPFNGACATKWFSSNHSTLHFHWCLCYIKWQKVK